MTAGLNFNGSGLEPAEYPGNNDAVQNPSSLTKALATLGSGEHGGYFNSDRRKMSMRILDFSAQPCLHRVFGAEQAR
ncbi:MAG TPA: hypothetical protein VEW46_06340 [Pyrinomonadaceae bacterium]|nr:hypothetical protein [Pyrinomonadaceae bacterium]